VIADTPFDFTFEPIVVAGRMAVLDNDIVYYRLTNALRSSPEEPVDVARSRRHFIRRIREARRPLRRARGSEEYHSAPLPPAQEAAILFAANPRGPAEAVLKAGRATPRAAPTSSPGSCFSTSSRRRRTAPSTRRSRFSTR